MNLPSLRLMTGLLVAPACAAAPIAYESFDYSAGTPLTTGAGGSGWFDAWFHDNASAVTATAGLAYTDAIGNALQTAGNAADTTGTTTTRSLRDLAQSPLNDVWISFLWQLPATNALFEGVSFYRGTQQVFSVSNPTTTATANIVLTNNLVNNVISNSQTGTFGRTHLVVARLIKGGGNGGTDRIEMFIDPLLSGAPSTPVAAVQGTNFDFDRVRIAGQNGAPLMVDELRIGTTFADVTPHISGSGVDTDGDGLTDAQEAVLGLDPTVSNAALIAAIKAHPEWFDLYTARTILALDKGGVMIPREGAATSVGLTFEVQASEDLTRWVQLHTYTRQVELPSGKNFLRLTLDHH